MAEVWKTSVRAKLIAIYALDDLVVLLSYLDFFAQNYETLNPGSTSPFWLTLKVLLEHSDEDSLKTYADGLLGEAYNEKEKSTRLNLQIQATNNDATRANNLASRFPAVFQYAREFLSDANGGSLVGVAAGIGATWDKLPPETQTKFILSISEKCHRRLGAVVTLSQGKAVVSSIAMVVVVVKCMWYVGRLYQGHITAKRCSKMCVDTFVEFGAGFAAGFAGATLGCMVNPFFGAFLGALFAIVGGVAANRLIDGLTLKVFDLPKCVAFENACRFLEVSHHSSKEQIKEAYNAKLQTINDGIEQKKAEQMGLLQVQMAIIEHSRN